MAATRHYSLQEQGRKGREIYRLRIEPNLGKDLLGKIVAIDVDTGEFEVGEKGLEAADKLRKRMPNAQIWCERVGYPAVHTFGYSAGIGQS